MKNVFPYFESDLIRVASKAKRLSEPLLFAFVVAPELSSFVMGEVTGVSDQYRKILH